MAPQNLTSKFITTPPFLNILSTIILLSFLYIIYYSFFTSSTPLHQQQLEESPKTFHFEFCTSNYTNHCPCEDPIRQKKFPKRKWFRKERHCPQRSEKLRCLIPRPVGYKRPFTWPESKDSAWFSNVPFSKLVEYKKSQNWVRLEGERFVFPGGGTSFPQGVKGYVDALKSVLPVPLESGVIRTALDVGCGVSLPYLFSFFFMLSYRIMDAFGLIKCLIDKFF